MHTHKYKSLAATVIKLLAAVQHLAGGTANSRPLLRHVATVTVNKGGKGPPRVVTPHLPSMPSVGWMVMKNCVHP